MRRFPKLFVLGVAGGAMIVALAFIGIASAGHAGALTYSSTFDSSAQGWFGSGQHPGDTWASTGGNPGGYVRAHGTAHSYDTYIESGGVSPGSTWVPGNALHDYGGKFQVDLKGSNAGAATIFLISNNSSVALCSKTAGALATAWTTYSVNLDLSGFQNCVPWPSGSRKPLTGAMVSAALAGFRLIEVSVSNHGAGSYDLGLDNASLSGPKSAVTPPTGTITRAFTKLRLRGHRLRGSLVAANDYSCAGKTRITIFRRGKEHPVKVATATTSAANRLEGGAAPFRLKLQKVHNGVYYARVARSKSLLDGNTCEATRSKGVRVR